ncbi:MAG: exo-alpha-sialidase [Planctomycetes bacterium]|nr:exo-alpha-sialidase [Planctomycetota bacterium]MBI3834370.1 exo-alpha-sialidase [Planctomycetota bacterium]
MRCFQLQLSAVAVTCVAISSSWAQQAPRVGPSGHRTVYKNTPPPEVGVAAAGADVALGGTNEPAVAINIFNPNNVVMSSLFQSRVSMDGGLTWTAPRNNTIPAGYGRDGDPSLAFDAQGRWFYAYQGFIGANGADEFVSRMDPTTGNLISGPVKVSVSGASGNENDKSWLAADHFAGSPFANRLYSVWTEFPTSGSERVLTAFSVNNGASWSAPLQLSTVSEGFAWPPHVAVAPNGDVYIAYHSQPGFFCNPDGSSGKTIVMRSINGGVSFPQKTLAFGPGASDVTYNVQDCPDGVIPGAAFWLQGSLQPWVLPDPQIPGSLYIVANDDPDNNHDAGDAADIFIARSADNGLTWGAPIRVDHGPGTTFQVMPTAAIDNSTGCIAVMWYDNRNGALNASGHYMLDVFYTISNDRGLTWAPDVQLNDVAIDPDRGAPHRFEGPPPTLRIGEYIGVALQNGVMHGVWTGNGVGPNQQIVTDSLLDVCADIPLAPLAEPDGVEKVRWISFVVPSDGNIPPVPTALRVTLNSLHHPDPPNLPQFPAPDFSAFENQVRWVGPVSTCTESDILATTFHCARLQCAPYYTSWADELGGNPLHVTGPEIVPSSRYSIENVPHVCLGAEAFCSYASSPLSIATFRWGDVVAPFQTPSPDPLTQPNISDVAGLTDKFKGVLGAPIVARGDINPDTPNKAVDIADIANCIDGFRSLAYPFAGPTACP